MEHAHVRRVFTRIGARVAFEAPLASRFRRTPPADVTIDVVTDRRGECFEIRHAPDRVELDVLQARPDLRHLLLLVRGGGQAEGPTRFLCGHDERHWFVAGVAGGSSVREAMEALKPKAARRSQARRKVRRKDRNRRKNVGFLRQGEWFFVPVPEVDPDDWIVLEKEPIRRARGKPHVVEFAFRTGGRQVWVCDLRPGRVLEQPEYVRLLREKPEEKRMGWRTMTRDPVLYARGWVRHPDHKTLRLFGWHRVLPNTEVASVRNVFLD